MGKRKWTNAEIEEYRKEHGVGFYFNPEDSNLLVPKCYGFGRTLNWANPVAWIIALAIVGFIVWTVFFK